MNKITEIVTAWSRAINPSQEDLEKATLRYEKCQGCYYNWNLFGLEVCRGCGCPLEGKVFTPKGKEECPLERWEI